MDLSTHIYHSELQLFFLQFSECPISETLEMAFLFIYPSDHNFSDASPSIIALGPQRGENFHFGT